MTLFGVSTWVWTSPLDHHRIRRLAPRIAGLGFDLAELPIEDVSDWDPGRAAVALQANRLGATTCAVMSGARDLTTGDRATTATTQGYLRASVDLAAAVGSRVLAGPMYSPVGRVWRLGVGERTVTIRRLIEALRPVVDYAGLHRVRLALEPLNRYETSLINTVDQAMEVVDAVDSPALGICLDTFHLNVEERDPVAATARAGGRIAHVQACGTDRGSPGRDRFDWPGFVAALGAAGYTGPVCIESFTVENAAIARAASIWRPLAPSQDALAVDGLAFLRQAFAADPADLDGALHA